MKLANVSSGLLIGLVLASCIEAAGLVVFRTEAGLQFADTATITVNDKDKALSLGTAPALSGPINKLQSVRLGSMLLMDSDTGVVAQYERGSVNYVVPDGAPKNAPGDPAGLWKIAKVSYKQSDKKAADLPAGSVVAFLPDGVEGLARLCLDDRAMQLIGGKAKAFPMRIELVTAAVKAYGSNPALAPVEKFVAQSMRERYEQFESGSGAAALAEGLRVAELSQAAYPDAPGHAELRKKLSDRKQWLDRRMAILRGFHAVQEWDVFLLGSRDFEKYHAAFPDIAALYTAALKQSLQMHRETGDARQKEGEYGAAYREFQLASRRQPSDTGLLQKIAVAWADYSRQLAIDNQRNRKQLTPGQREAIDQNLTFASRFQQEGRLDRALEEIRKAEMVDSESLPVLLKKAELLAVQRDYGKALQALDDYDRHAIDDERRRSSQLRTTLLFERNGVIEKVNAEFRKAWDAGAYYKAGELARYALRTKDDEPQFLLHAGTAALVARDGGGARDFLTRYLEISTNLDANPEQRARVRRLLAASGPAGTPAPVTTSGDVNWLSGSKLSKGIYYCPVSLAFQPRIDHIEASNKLRTAYQWEGERLKAIVPTFEKGERVTGEKKISFAYDAKVPAVLLASYEESSRPVADPDEKLRRASQVLPNYPDFDPAAIQALTGKNVTLGIAGNRFFHPFVWEKLHFFRFTYDAQGRVAQAREIAEGGAPGTQWLDFEWDGPKLTAVRGYQGTDEKQRVKNYERILQYQSGRLVSEEIRGQGKQSRITYKYNANRLVSAECDRDVTLDDRSRQVTFLASSATVVVQ